MAVTPNLSLPLMEGQQAEPWDAYNDAMEILDDFPIITTDEKDALDGANSPDAGNPLATMDDVALKLTAPVTPAAFTQTYSTSDHTVNAYTPDDESAAYVSTPATLADAATLADLNTLRVAYENLRAMNENLLKVINGLLDDLQTAGVVG